MIGVDENNNEVWWIMGENVGYTGERKERR